MEKKHLPKPSAAVALMVAAGMVAALVPAVLPTPAWAVVACPATETGADSDGDGFTDSQECQGITLADGAVVPTCASPPPDRTACLDPNTKDLFVIYAPATSGSLLPAGFNPFVNPLTAYGLTFRGLATLGITVHQLTPAQAAADRTVTAGSTQRAVKYAESLDTGGSILGFCQWGTPNGLDGCTVYTQRILNFISNTCAGLVVVTPGGVSSTASDAFLAYAIHVSLHETGHTTGGATGVYNSSYGGNHWAAADSPGRNGAGTRMEQYVTYSTKGGKCKFNVPADFDASLDPPAVNLR